MRRRADEPHGAAFHVGQQHILLCFVETVNLIDEKQRGVTRVLQPIGSTGQYLPHLGHVALHAAQSHEPAGSAVGDDLGECCLAGSGRSVKNQRLNPVCLNGAAQQHAL